ncbi:GtrA family protein [Mycetocola spongiae]|uniref:GtrA family protein n=1 Tax=Mycetocola spongiae TaxID=2859226 RepID=UPI001CF13FD4|nr:GtrA family protein [Mycetocola spongiae]UCR89696.1 GtrA family protein [Mycetocola spongiae]
MSVNDSGSAIANLVKRLLARQEIRYLLVAGLTSLFYLLLVGAGLLLNVHYFIAILIAQAITILCAFPFYRAFVFQSTSGLRGDFIRFLSVWLSGMVAGLVLTPLLVEILRWHPLLSQVVAIGLVSIASFLGHRFFSFRKKE